MLSVLGQATLLDGSMDDAGRYLRESLNAAEEPVKEPTGAERALGIPAGGGVEGMATPERVDVEPGPGAEETEEAATPTTYVKSRDHSPGQGWMHQ